MASIIDKCLSPLNNSIPYRACHQNANDSYSDLEALQLTMIQMLSKKETLG